VYVPKVHFRVFRGKILLIILGLLTKNEKNGNF